MDAWNETKKATTTEQNKRLEVDGTGNLRSQKQEVREREGGRGEIGRWEKVGVEDMPAVLVIVAVVVTAVTPITPPPFINSPDVFMHVFDRSLSLSSFRGMNEWIDG